MKDHSLGDQTEGPMLRTQSETMRAVTAQAQFEPGSRFCRRLPQSDGTGVTLVFFGGLYDVWRTALAAAPNLGNAYGPSPTGDVTFKARRRRELVRNGTHPVRTAFANWGD